MCQDEGQNGYNAAGQGTNEAQMRFCFVSMLLLLACSTACRNGGGGTHVEATVTALQASARTPSATHTPASASIVVPTATPRPDLILLDTIRPMCQPTGSYPVKFDLTDQMGWVVCQGGGAGMVMPKQIYRTQDGGASWSLISKRQFGTETPVAGVGLAPSATALDIIFQDDMRGWMIVGSAGAGLHRTADGGYTWDAIEELGNDLGRVLVTFTEDSDIVVRTQRGDWISHDDGASWSPHP